MITHIKKFITLVLVCMLSLSVVSCDSGECDHDYGKWTVKKEATCMEKGKKVRKCEKCGEQDKKSIAIVDHQFDEDGICTMCNRSEEEMLTGPGSVITPSEYPTDGIPTEPPIEYPTGEHPTGEQPTEGNEDDYSEISVGQQVDCYIEGYTSKYFRFVPEHSGEYIFYSSTIDEIDPSVSLLDWDMNYITEDDDGGGDWNFSLSYYMNAGEVYYFQVYTPQSGELCVNLVEHGLENAVEIVEGNYVSVDIDYSGATKYYYFVADYSGVYVVTTYSSYSDIGAYGQVLDQYGNSLPATVTQTSYETREWVVVEEGQMYYIAADCNSNRWNVSYDLTLNTFYDSLSYNTVDYVDDWRYVHAESGDDKVYYAFTPMSDGHYVINSKPYYDVDEYYADARLYDYYGNLIASDDHMGANGGIHIAYEMQGGQTYFLEATSDYGYSAEYYICFSYERMYFELSEGYSKTVEVENPYYKEYFTFIPEYSGTYNFYSTSDGYVDTYATLLDADGNEITSADSGGEAGNFGIIYYLEAGEEYCFVASMYSHSLGYFDVHFEAVDVWDPDSMTEISAGDSQYVYINSAGGCEYFAYTPSVSGFYCFTSTGGDWYDTYVELYNASGEIIASNEEGAGNGQFKMIYYFEADQTYYLGVRLADSYATGEFYVNVSEYHELSDGYSCGVNVESAYHKEYFTFIPQYSGTYSFYSTNDESLDTHVIMYDVYGEAIDSDDSGGANGNFRMSYYLEAGEAYCFEAGMWSDLLGAFEVHFEAVNTLNPDTTIEISLGESYEVYISAEGGAQYFVYTPSISGDYYFTSTGGDWYDTYGEIYNASGDQIAYDDDGASSRQFYVECYMEAGQTYYLCARFYGSSTGSFYVSLAQA
ncbi:MAG: hypothetical protein E7667_03440 [Ruminococcaceae bacterium]|nr:hypothetical protein [Oscillospiraceae bacterium]